MKGFSALWAAIFIVVNTVEVFSDNSPNIRIADMGMGRDSIFSSFSASLAQIRSRPAKATCLKYMVLGMVGGTVAHLLTQKKNPDSPSETITINLDMDWLVPAVAGGALGLGTSYAIGGIGRQRKIDALIEDFIQRDFDSPVRVWLRAAESRAALRGYGSLPSILYPLAALLAEYGDTCACQSPQATWTSAKPERSRMLAALRQLGERVDHTSFYIDGERAVYVLEGDSARLTCSAPASTGLDAELRRVYRNFLVDYYQSNGSLPDEPGEDFSRSDRPGRDIDKYAASSSVAKIKSKSRGGHALNFLKFQAASVGGAYGIFIPMGLIMLPVSGLIEYMRSEDRDYLNWFFYTTVPSVMLGSSCGAAMVAKHRKEVFWTTFALNASAMAFLLHRYRSDRDNLSGKMMWTRNLLALSASVGAVAWLLDDLILPDRGARPPRSPETGFAPPELGLGRDRLFIRLRYNF